MFTRILVPTDFSEPSDAALVYAKAVARRFGASLHLMHVVENPAATGMLGGEFLIQDVTGIIAALKGRIANFKVPKRCFVVAELPRNAMGKVQKNLLREQHKGLFAA